jgi:hypothetical protein
MLPPTFKNKTDCKDNLENLEISIEDGENFGLSIVLAYCTLAIEELYYVISNSININARINCSTCSSIHFYQSEDFFLPKRSN